MSRRRRRTTGVALSTMVLVWTVAIVGVQTNAVPPASADDSAITGVMLSLENGVVTGSTTELVGWTMGLIGLNSAQDNDFDEISDELATIASQLEDIDSELATLEETTLVQTCDQNSDTTEDARSDITNWNTQLETIQKVGPTSPTDISTLMANIIADVPNDLAVIQTALMNSGSATGIIESCLATLTTPDDSGDLLGDTSFYDNVSDLTAYYYGYQVEAVNLLAEYYHYQAMNFYLAENAASSVDASNFNAICNSPSPYVASNCLTAWTYTYDVYEGLQDQFAFAGAPYSVADEAMTVNNTPYVLVMSQEDFTAAQGSTCSSPLDSSDPCGPLVGTNLTTSIPQTVTYAWRQNWVPSNPEVWRTVLSGWFGEDSTVMGTYLSTLGFANVDGSNKIILTNATYNAEPNYDDGSPIFSEPAVCFAYTGVDYNHGHQTWCGNGEYNSQDDYGESTDLLTVKSYPNDGYCAANTADTEFTDPDTGGFFDGTYEWGGEEDGCLDAWEDGVQPGWILDSDTGASHEQFLWPMFDMSTATCNTNADGSTRSVTNAVGVYTMCGSDFDTWFAEQVPALDPPPSSWPTTTTTTSTTAATSAPTATVTPSTTLTAGQSFTVDSSGWDDSTGVTVTLNSTPTVLDNTTVDSSGNLTRTYRVPTTIEPGSHTLVLDGTFHGAPFAVTVNLTVLAATTANPVTVAPRFTG